MEERQWKPKTERMDRDKEKERQRKSKTGRIDERTWRNDSGRQRQTEWTKERERTTVEAMTERMHETERKKDSGNQRQGELDERTMKERQRKPID